MNELPLQELFTKLREAGLSLGIDEYQLVLRSLQAGFGIADRAALKRLCQTLWVKSAEEKSILNYYFEQIIGSDTVTSVLGENSETVNQSRLLQIYCIVTFAILGILGIGIAAVVYIENQKPPKTQPTATPTPLATVTQEPQPTQAENAIQPETATPQPTQSKTATPQTTQSKTATPQPTPTAKLTIQPILPTKQPNLILWIILFLTAITFEYLLYRWFSNWLSQRKTEPNSNSPASTPPQINKDEVQVVKSVLLATSNHLSNEFFPVTQRQMKQTWRNLRRPVRFGKATELDVEATVNHIGHQGMLLEPVLIPPRVNRSELLLLIDQDGSMVPFHALSQRLVETALDGGRLGRTGIYYFHNSPVEYLYRDPYHQEGELVSNILTHRCSQRTAILIFSDAGAARGGYRSHLVSFLEI